MRRFRDCADPRLAEEIRAFTKQETIHSREHLAFNRRAAEAGYDLAPLESRVEERLKLLNGKPPVISLAATMVLEHFTAMLAHAVLADPALLDGADDESVKMWRWHADEEIEHKGVAFDTWLAATDDAMCFASVTNAMSRECRHFGRTHDLFRSRSTSIGNEVRAGFVPLGQTPGLKFTEIASI